MMQGVSDKTPGCVLGVHSKNVDLLRAYGQADLERNVALNVDSVFNIASASKQFTAAAVLLLANEGKVSLADDIRKYLPELPAQRRPITIDNLLSHTSGLRDFRYTDWLVGRDALPQRNQDILDYASRLQSLNHAPGESYSYSNTGYVLLAIIVERVTGQNLQDFSRERLFQPAGMMHTQWEVDSTQLVRNRAYGYVMAEPAHEGHPPRFVQSLTDRNTYGHGNLLTTAGDLQRWNIALSRNAYGPELTTQLEERATLSNGFVINYARGEFVGKYRGFLEVKHVGYNGNYIAWVARYPEADLAVSYVCNSDADNVEPYDLVDLFLPADAPAREAGPAQGSDDLSARNGVYRRIDNGQLALWTFPAKARLDSAKFVMGPYTYQFDGNHPEQITRLSYGNAVEWVRAPKSDASVATRDEYQGRFISDELLASYYVTFDGKQLKMTLRGLSHLVATLQPRATDVFEAQDLPQMQGTLVVFKRDNSGRVNGLAIAPDGLHELPFRKVPTGYSPPLSRARGAVWNRQLPPTGP
ncbi:serine hydrolase domain-containing protein [uncultured Stenotrophomonas sp.]|uniref:serine hydrolase domain-containing protein n=1 Tax=uncultured Stenotrophomonas sp. TaxID=165438 RepID=UPI0028E8F651|nr:serine hydrolase domain-containing protein [uncultured Stenotrophomonas sp.]